MSSVLAKRSRAEFMTSGCASESIEVQVSRKYKKTFTITLGDQAENHVGMQKIGSMADKGFTLEDLEVAKAWFESRGVGCELMNLKTACGLEHSLAEKTKDAFVLIARGALDIILSDDEKEVGDKSEAATSIDESVTRHDVSTAVPVTPRPGGTVADNFFREQDCLEKDKRAFMYGRVVDKHARHNLCFGEESQEPEYEKKKGRVIAYREVPLLDKLRRKIPDVIGDIGDNLVAEGNYYYDLAKCGIGYHGDTERQKVVGVRVGATLPLCFAWFHKSEKVQSSRRFKVDIGHGDVYFFSEKATGNDWKKKTILTLRHAAGASKFIDF